MIFLIQIIDNVIAILIFAIVIRAILSFVPQLRSSNNKALSLLYDVTDPILKPFQRFQIGGAAMAIDLSPIIAIIVLKLIGSLSRGLLSYFF
ncbi:MAG TPA: YggT family protein [Desulfosporosinus sp.]|nr:YggT family protein [Desulfosporosinus sp.]